jgi:ESCRT-I complex subunit VPS37
VILCCRREDLEDLLIDPVYFQTIFHSLGYVKDLYRSQSELGMANEAIARMYNVVFGVPPTNPNPFTGNNLALQQRLYDLRAETKDAFDEAKRLEARWKELEKEQKEVYQVFLGLSTSP